MLISSDPRYADLPAEPTDAQLKAVVKGEPLL